MSSAVRLSMIAALILLATCDSVDNFQIQQKASSMIEGKTPLMMLLGNVGFGGFNDFDITANQSLRNQGVTKEQIDSVRVTRITMTIIAPPSGQDFTFLDKLEFFVTAPNLERKRIASGGPFPAGQTSVELVLDDVNLKPYVTAPTMDITTNATGEAPDNDTTIEAEMHLDVDVDVGGAICG